MISKSVLIEEDDHGGKGYACYERRVNNPVGGVLSDKEDAIQLSKVLGNGIF